MAEAGRRAWVDLAKGLAIVMVVAYHALQLLEAADVGVAPLGRARVPLELYPMPAFFLLAGLMQGRLRTSPWGRVWRRRVLPMLYLLVVWSVVRFVFFTLVPGVRSDGPPASGRDPWRLLTALVAPDSIYWFLWSLAAVTVLTWLGRRWARTSVVVALLVSAVVTSGLLTTGVFAWDRTAAFLAPFVVGVHLGPAVLRVVEAATWPRVALLLGATGVVLALLVVVPLSRRVPGAVLLAQAAVLVGVLGAAVLTARYAWTRPLQDVGRRSLQVYLVHLYPVALLTLVVVHVPVLHDVPGRGLPLVLVVAGLAVVASLVVTRYLPARWRLLQMPVALLGRGRTGDAPPRTAPPTASAPTAAPTPTARATAAAALAAAPAPPPAVALAPPGGAREPSSPRPPTPEDR